MTLKSASCFEVLANSLKEYTNDGRVLTELVNGVNWAGALIHACQRRFFEIHNIPYIWLQRGREWSIGWIYKAKSLPPTTMFF